MRALLLFLLLSGCGSGDEGNNNHGYGFQFDAQGPSGLKLRGSTDTTSFENDFAATETCTGLKAPAPFVILVPKGALGIADNHYIIGRYINNPSLILLEQESSMKHESIHYLLDMNTNDQGDPNHTSPFFVSCV